MIEIVTLDEARLFCRTTPGDGFDDQLAILIGAATEAVIDTAEGWTPVVGQPAPDRIKLAVLHHVMTAFGGGGTIDLPADAVRLLTPLRKLDV